MYIRLANLLKEAYTLKTGTPVEDADSIRGVSCPEIQLGVGIYSKFLGSGGYLCRMNRTSGVCLWISSQ